MRVAILPGQAAGDVLEAYLGRTTGRAGRRRPGTTLAVRDFSESPPDGDESII